MHWNKFRWDKNILWDSRFVDIRRFLSQWQLHQSSWRTSQKLFIHFRDRGTCGRIDEYESKRRRQSCICKKNAPGDKRQKMPRSQILSDPSDWVATGWMYASAASVYLQPSGIMQHHSGEFPCSGITTNDGQRKTVFKCTKNQPDCAQPISTLSLFLLPAWSLILGLPIEQLLMMSNECRFQPDKIRLQRCWGSEPFQKIAAVQWWKISSRSLVQLRHVSSCFVKKSS